MIRNPFEKANDLPPSTSLFAKEKQESIRASDIEIDSLDTDYSGKEFLGIKMNKNTKTYFETLITLIGEEKTFKLLNNKGTKMDTYGNLIELNCKYLGSASYLPELPESIEWLGIDRYLNNLPGGLKGLDYSFAKIRSLPPLPPELIHLNCGNTMIESLPDLPKGLKKLICNNTGISTLPELPAELELLDCSDTSISSLQSLPAKLKILRCQRSYLEDLPDLPEGLEVVDCGGTPLSDNNELINTLRAKNPKTKIFTI